MKAKPMISSSLALPPLSLSESGFAPLQRGLLICADGINPLEDLDASDEHPAGGVRETGMNS
jgi:hypothetical protein